MNVLDVTRVRSTLAMRSRTGNGRTRPSECPRSPRGGDVRESLVRPSDSEPWDNTSQPR